MIAVFLTKDSQLIGKYMVHIHTTIEVNNECEFFHRSYHILDHGMLVLAISEWRGPKTILASSSVLLATKKS